MLNGRARSGAASLIQHSTFNIEHSTFAFDVRNGALRQRVRTHVTQKSALRLVAEPLAIAIVLAFGVRAAMRLYVIPSSSMAPTLVPGDHIVVTPYRFGKKPNRGDVIVFRSPRTADELMIKRVIGTPGDLVETRAGRVIVCEAATRSTISSRTPRNGPPSAGSSARRASHWS